MEIIKKEKCPKCKGKLYEAGLTRIEGQCYNIGKCVDCNYEHIL